jgi:hypothetical protein
MSALSAPAFYIMLICASGAVLTDGVLWALFMIGSFAALAWLLSA